MASVNAVMCSKTRHARAPSNTAAGNGKRIREPACVHRTAGAFAGHDDLRARRLDADHGCCTHRHPEPGELPLAGADVEETCDPGEVLAHERDDLLFVLRVGAVGEAVLPPLGVRVPGADIGH